jgi:tRNA threonylcarbamoyladenosine biosynthesis protein TsaB
MFILGIETSSDICSIGITSKENFLSELSAHTHNAHSESLFPGILNVINTAGMNMKDLSGVAVSSGPGSFTGLRIGKRNCFRPEYSTFFNSYSRYFC